MIEYLVLAVIFIVSGCITGFLSALFGIGGGLVVVPVLYLFFKYSGMPAHVVMHLAVGTSLAVMIFTSIGSCYHHWRAGDEFQLKQRLTWAFWLNVEREL